MSLFVEHIEGEVRDLPNIKVLSFGLIFSFSLIENYGEWTFYSLLLMVI